MHLQVQGIMKNRNSGESVCQILWQIIHNKEREVVCIFVVYCNKESKAVILRTDPGGGDSESWLLPITGSVHIIMHMLSVISELPVAESSCRMIFMKSVEVE